MYIAIIFCAGVFAGVVGTLSVIVLTGAQPGAAPLPPATARAIARDRKASRPVLLPMPRDPRPWVSPARADFDGEETRS